MVLFEQKRIPAILLFNILPSLKQQKKVTHGVWGSKWSRSIVAHSDQRAVLYIATTPCGATHGLTRKKSLENCVLRFSRVYLDS